MKLKWIEYKNFLAVGSKPIRIQLDEYNTVAVLGKNGSGKSTVLESIAYALFGKMLSNIKIAQAINTKNKKNLFVTACFDVNGSEYIVNRGQKPKVFEIIKDGLLIDQSASERDYQKLLEHVIGCDFKTFTQVVALNKERYVPFMDMKPAQRRQVIDEILDIGIYTAIDRVAASKLSNAKIEYQKALTDKQIIATQIKGKEELVASLEHTNKSHVDDLNSEKSKALAELEMLKESENQLNDVMLDLDKEIAEINPTVIKETAAELVSIKQSINIKLNEIRKMKSFFDENSNCPVCHQHIDNEFKHEHVTNLDSEMGELTEDMAAVNEEEVEVKKSQDTANEILSLTQTVKQDIRDVQRNISTLNNRIKELDIKLKESAETDLSKSLTLAIADLESLNQSLVDQDGVITEKDTTVTRYENIRKQTADTGIKASIIADYLPVFNKKINEYLYEMEFYVGIELNESFEESFKAANKQGFSYEQLSTGQKCRVNLAIWLALLEIAAIKNSISTNVLFLDEILEPMDTEGVEMFIGLCRNKLTTSNIFVITQRGDEFKNLFDGNLSFKLNSDYTEMM